MQKFGMTTNKHGRQWIKGWQTCQVSHIIYAECEIYLSTFYPQNIDEYMVGKIDYNTCYCFLSKTRSIQNSPPWQKLTLFLPTWCFGNDHKIKSLHTEMVVWMATRHVCMCIPPPPPPPQLPPPQSSILKNIYKQYSLCLYIIQNNIYIYTFTHKKKS